MGSGAIDPADFQRWYDEVAADLYRYVQRLASSPAEADDLFQESFARFIGASFDSGDPAERRRYLFRIATNLARDRQRWSRRWTFGVLGERGGTSPDGGYDRRLDVERVLGGLPPRSRALLWLAYAEGFSHQEIAEVVGVGATSVRVLLARARRKFLAEFDRQSPDDRSR